MPTYDYECRACGNRIEVIHSMADEGPSSCERCGGPMRRVLHPTGIIFKGSGFYKTDSRRDAAASGETGGSGGAPKPATTPKSDAPAAAPTGGDAAPSTGSAATTEAPTS